MEFRMVEPKSKKSLDQAAKSIRDVLRCKSVCFLPLAQILEYILPEVYNLDLEIKTLKEMGLNTEAVTYPDQNLMCIREDVYEKLLEDNGRARFTVAHEIGHFFLHCESQVSYARTNEIIPAYKNPEWQANTFASYFLIPDSMILPSDNEITIAERFGVSEECARIRLFNYRKEHSGVEARFRA